MVLKKYTCDLNKSKGLWKKGKKVKKLVGINYYTEKDENKIGDMIFNLIASEIKDVGSFERDISDLIGEVIETGKSPKEVAENYIDKKRSYDDPDDMEKTLFVKSKGPWKKGKQGLYDRLLEAGKKDEAPSKEDKEVVGRAISDNIKRQQLASNSKRKKNVGDSWSDEQFISDQLVNNEASSDEELYQHFLNNGISSDMAEEAIRRRSEALRDPLNFHFDKSRTIGAKDKIKRKPKPGQKEAYKEAKKLYATRKKLWKIMEKDKWHGETKDGKPYAPRVQLTKLHKRLKQIYKKYPVEISNAPVVHKPSKEESKRVQEYYDKKGGGEYTGD